MAMRERLRVSQQAREEDVDASAFYRTSHQAEIRTFFDDIPCGWRRRSS
jgi:hypothetical protein